MRRGYWFGIAALGLLAAAGAVAWRALPRTSAGQFDPVAAVIALASLAVAVATLRLAIMAQQRENADVVSVARRLGIAVNQAESEARRQLLDGHDRTIDVQFSFRPAPGQNVARARRNGTLNEVVSYYRESRPRRMVITGGAGSGKTVLAIELILGLLEGRAAADPVPVRMSAADLDTTRPPGSAVQDWLARHLTQTYGLPKAAARQLVAARMVLPVLDGLDEMDATEQPGYASRAGRAVRACNAYLDGRQKAAMVLTCRTGQYEALAQAHEWVHGAARVQLRPVGPTVASNFLAHGAADAVRWSPVVDAIPNIRRSSRLDIDQAFGRVLPIDLLTANAGAGLRIRMHWYKSPFSAGPVSLWHARREAARLATGWSTRRR